MRIAVTSALVATMMASTAMAGGHAGCADGKTLEEGVLTIATGNPPTTLGCSTMRRKAVKALKRLSLMPWLPRWALKRMP